MNYKGGFNMNKNKKGQSEIFVGLFIIVLVIASIVLLCSFRIVGYNEYAIEKEFGQIKGDFKDPGFTWVGIGSLIRVNNQIRNYDITVDGFSRDKQQVVLDLIVNLKMKKEFVKDFILNYKDEATYEEYITNKIQDEVKTILSKYEAQYALDNRDLLSEELTVMLQGVKEIEYFEFNDVVIDDIRYSEEYRAILEESARIDIEREIIIKEKENNIELKKNIDVLDIDSYLKYKIANKYTGGNLYLGGEFLASN